MHVHPPFTRSLSRSWRVLAFILTTISALPAQADSGTGVDTWHATKLDPTAGAMINGCDPLGTSWLIDGVRRTPTGNLLSCPPPAADPNSLGGWQYYGVLQFGYLGTNDDVRNMGWGRFAGWSEGGVLGLFNLTFERPDDGSYANVRATRLSDDNQYYQAMFGRTGSFKVRAFLRDTPNIVSVNAKPLWNGVGTNNLTLPDSLAAGASTPAQVTAALDATSERILSVKRSKMGADFSMFLTHEWTAYANVTNERRKGARPYGGSFFFNYPFPGNGGALETAKPIDDTTINFGAGIRYGGEAWRMNLAYSGSLYRDDNSRYTFQSPFGLYPVVPGAVSAPLYQGQMSTEPDNDYHNLKATLTRKLPMNGEFSLTASAGRMSQNDVISPPIDCQGVFGIGMNGSLQLGSQNPFLFNCANWNTTGALSRRTANMRIDTTLVDARIVLQPVSNITVRSSLRFNRANYRGTYTAYNSLTGDYGYVAENGSQGSVVPGEVGLFNPLTAASVLTRIRNLPIDQQTLEGTLGADWRPNIRNTLGATYTFNRYEPSNRERQQVDDNSIKLTWVNRILEWATLRANYMYLRQNGNRYDYDPYTFIYSSSLPGYVPPSGGIPSHTVEAMRKYDLSSRDQNKASLMVTTMPRTDMTLSASLRGDWNSYDAQIGRQSYDTYGATVQWEWQAAPLTNMSVYGAWDQSRLHLANVQDQQGGAGINPALGGPNYAFDGAWDLRNKQRNYYAGATFDHTIGRIRFDANWNYIYSRGLDNYSYGGPSALAYPNTASGTGPGSDRFPAMIYRVQSFMIGATMPLTKRVSLRVFDYFEFGSINDWHYLGFDTNRVYDHRVYTDGGPQNYKANVFGVLFNVQL